uniref:Apolipoprotein M n=1 Tax=Callorhinchus milii TaxID=7868 RepID=A0A4W3GYC8_CALMI
MILQWVCVWLLYLFCLGVQGRDCAFDDEMLGVDFFNDAKFHGKWYVVTLAANTQEKVEKLKNMKNVVFNFIKKENQKIAMEMEFTSAESDTPIRKTWNFFIDEATKHLKMEEYPGREFQVFIPKCEGCMIGRDTQKVVNPTFDRIILYTRNPTVGDDVINDFKKRAKCLNLDKM